MSNLSHYRGIPERIRVGCYIFRVEVREIEDHEAEGTFGHMNPINQKIAIRPGMSPQNLANTFIHETLHAIHWYHGLMGLDPNAFDVEEEYTTKGANGLCSFWQDNPKAVAWWSRLLKMEGMIE